MAKNMAKNHATRGIPQRQTKRRTDDTWWAISDQPPDAVGFFQNIDHGGWGHFCPPLLSSKREVETLIRFSRALVVWLF